MLAHGKKHCLFAGIGNLAKQTSSYLEEVVMSTRNPQHIICAVRGGPETRNTVNEAIEIALDFRSRLTFLHVLDATFLEYATIGPLSVVYRELNEMGTFAMLILSDRAVRRGIEIVDFVLPEGNIHDELVRYANETKAEMMVMGRPNRNPGKNVFRIEEFDAFVAQLEQEANLKIVTVPAEQQ
jgi:nucleotide-binding universal stress UspA family protein